MSEESAIEFPCEFPIKMMGRDTPDFRQTMRALVEGHVGDVDETRVQSIISRNLRFVSVTITITATSQQQLDAIYRDVSAHDDVLMVL